MALMPALDFISFLYYCVCALPLVYMRARHKAYVEVGRQLPAVNFPLPLCGSHGLDTAQETWQQSTLPTDPFPWLHSRILGHNLMHLTSWEYLREPPIALLMFLTVLSVCLSKQSHVAQADLKLALWQSDVNFWSPISSSAGVTGERQHAQCI